MIKDIKIASIYFLLSLFFVTSFYANLELIPLNWLLVIFGLPKSGMGFFILMFHVMILNFIIYFTLGIYAKRYPEKRKWADDIYLKQGKLAMFSFFTIWITIFSFGIMAMLKIYSNIISLSQLVNLYLFWFFIFKALGKIIPIKTEWQGYR